MLFYSNIFTPPTVDQDSVKTSRDNLVFLLVFWPSMDNIILIGLQLVDSFIPKPKSGFMINRDLVKVKWKVTDHVLNFCVRCSGILVFENIM